MLGLGLPYSPDSRGTVIDEDYIELTAAVHNATDYGELAVRIATSLPPLMGGGFGVVLNYVTPRGLEAVFGAPEVAGRFKDLPAPVPAAMTVTHALDPRDARQRGVSIHDEEFREDPGLGGLMEVLDPGAVVSDAIFGAICHCLSRASVMMVTRQSGRFTDSERQLFDLLLLAARASAKRIAMSNIEIQVRKFYLSRPQSAPNAWFLVRASGEVLPFNYEAIQLAERWWSEDDAFHELGESGHEALRTSLARAWRDPLIAEFAPVEIDLGGGSMCFHALPRHDGEIILIHSTQERAAQGEAMLATLLTKRQQEIMSWIAEGKTSAEVAIILEISPRTVEKHLEAVFQRLGVENRITAVRRYLDLKAGSH